MALRCMVVASVALVANPSAAAPPSAAPLDDGAAVERAIGGAR